uniref:protein LURP-one-related 7 isoform X2 n=1 Tax=Erigeron canadensis TaxID=72917 RepID=UPI001CB8B317|nr:protein LURP-one-related 7 isoform X2 [Erigeron canadensis]
MESYEGGGGDSYNPNPDGISTDLFVSKTKSCLNSNNNKNKVVSGGLCIKFTDSVGNLVFSVRPPPPPCRSHSQRLVSDSSGNPLISIAHNQGFAKDGKDLIFKVERTTNTLTKVEFQVFLNNDESTFKMRGSPFHRSCTIYNGDSVVAQTSLMYKLGIQKVLVPRNRFRLTIFPGYADHAFIVALTAIFFYGRKLWI